MTTALIGPSTQDAASRGRSASTVDAEVHVGGNHQPSAAAPDDEDEVCLCPPHNHLTQLHKAVAFLYDNMDFVDWIVEELAAGRAITFATATEYLEASPFGGSD